MLQNRSHNGCETPRKSLERLEPWLKLANLLPPAPLRDELKFLDKEPIALWQAQCRGVPAAEFLHKFMKSRLARVPVLAATVHLPLLRDDPDQAPRFLELVSEMALILQTLVTAGSSRVLKATAPRPVFIKRLYQTPATARSEIWMRNGALTVSRIDAFKDFLTVLDGVEAARLRQCQFADASSMPCAKIRKPAPSGVMQRAACVTGGQISPDTNINAN